MTQLRTPALSALLLGLAALLVFGNCGGGVTGALYSLTARQRRQLRRVLLQDEQARRMARQQHGATRQQALQQRQATTQQQLDSLKLADYQQRKVRHRRRKVQRQLPGILRADSLQQLRQQQRLSDQ